MLRHLRRDPIVIAMFCGIMVMAGLYQLENPRVSLVIEEIGLYSHFLWLTLILASLLLVRGRFERKGDHFFWQILIVAFSVWLVARTYAEIFPYRWESVPLCVIEDFLYLVFYFCFAVAVERIPDGRGTSITQEAEQKLMGIAGPVTLALGLLTYLIIIPVIVKPEEYLTFMPSYLLYAMLDFYLAVRFLQAMRNALSERWKIQSAMFTLAFFMWGLFDLVDGLTEYRGVEIYSGIILDFFWYAPFLLVVSAIRLRHVLLPTSERVERSPGHRERVQKSGSFEVSLVIIALVLPVLHYSGYALQLLDPDTRSARMICILIYMLVIAFLELTGNRLRAALRGVRLQAEQAQKLESIGVLAGGVAHDFNNLLTVISGRSQLLLRGVDKGTPEESQLLEINNATGRASALIRKLLSFRPSDDHNPVIMDLNTVIAGMKGLLDGLTGDDHRFDITFDPRLNMVRADRALIEQVVMNLVVNAKDAMPDGGEISISTGNIEVRKGRIRRHDALDPGSWIYLEVRDPGVGIDARTMKRIFEPFFTTKPRSQGTGLGLSMIYGAIKKSGGEIQVESAPDEGATFRIYLPRVVGEVEVVGREAIEVAPMVGGSERILVAEDDPAVRLFVEDILIEHGYQVETAANGRKALNYLLSGSRKVDLVLTDVMMPEMGGVELAEEIGRRFPTIPILFMSGYTDDSPVHALRVAEGIRLLDKPFAPETLLQAIRETLSCID